MTTPKGKNKNQGFSKKEVEAIKDHGRKLGFLLKELSFSNELKQELVSLIEIMSLEQIERLIVILEDKYIEQSTKGIDEKLKQELESEVKHFKQEQEKLRADYSNKLKQFLKDIKI